MGIELLLLIILSFIIILSVPKINNKLPLNIQNITNKKSYFYGIFMFIILLSIFNIQYLVYFAILFIMVKVCFVDNDNFNDNNKEYLNGKEHLGENGHLNGKEHLGENGHLNGKEHLGENEYFGIPTSETPLNYYTDAICVKLSTATEDSENSVKQYSNNFFSPNN